MEIKYKVKIKRVKLKGIKVKEIRFNLIRSSSKSTLTGRWVL